MSKRVRSGLTTVSFRKQAQALTLVLAALFLLSACGANMDAPVLGSSNDVTQTPEPTSSPVVVVATPTLIAGGPVATATLGAVPAASSGDATSFPVNVTLDVSQVHPISPLIYGVADPTSADDDTLQWLGATLARWGGNARDMHNWETNDSNSGADDQFKNVKQGDDTPGSASLGFFNRNARLGLAGILTIPTLGWVARDSQSQSVDVPTHGGPPTSAGSDVANTQFQYGLWGKPYDPTANRLRTSVQSLPSKGAPFVYPPDLNDGKVYQDEWVAYLKATAARNSAPTIYAMDNEPESWADNTHVDVHPVRLGYDDELSNFLTYARAVKKVDANGLVIGPESWGVTGYLYSALDEGGDKFATSADRTAHGDLPFLDWFLRSVSESDKAAGSRSLDVLTVHYYSSQGEYTGGNDPAMQAQRVQSTRALWDGLYDVPGWVSQTEWGNLALIPRLRDLVAAGYPGTKLGLTEWNFGGENDISGAIATADALGIFGREGLYLASYRGLPAKDSSTGWAFRLYRNYDGKGAQFGSLSVETKSSNTEMLSAYGALDDARTKLTVMLINKDPARSAEASLAPQGFTVGSMATQYRYGAVQTDGPDARVVAVTDPKDIAVTVPPMSISLVVLNTGQK